MDTQYRKNLKTVLTASKNYTDNSIEKLKWELGTYDLSVETINGTTMLLPTPANTIQATMVRIDGASEVMVNDFDSNLTSISDDTGVTHSQVGNSYIIVNSSSSSSRIVLNTNLNGKHTIAFDSDTAISYGFRINSLSLQNNIVVGKNIFEDIEFTGNNPISIYVPANSTVTISNIVSTTNYFTNIHNLELSGLVIKNSDDEVMQTLPIDLSSILYNGNPLFEGNSLKAVGIAKDYITPYKAHKQMLYITLNGSENWQERSANNGTRFSLSLNYLCVNDTNNILNNRGLVVANAYSNTNAIRYTDNVLFVRFNQNETLEQFKANLQANPLVVVLPLATPIEADIDLSQLVKFEAHSNGSITLVNTNNQDTTSTFKYLKEVAK